MAKIPGYDLEGVKDIAAYLDLSDGTVKRLMRRRARPLPTVKYLAFVLAKKSALDAWRDQEIADPVYACGNAVHRTEERKSASGEAA